jgi:hypothetical protein
LANNLPNSPHSLQKISDSNGRVISKVSVVQNVAETLEHVFGKSTMFALKMHLSQDGVSFEDASIVEQPERFIEVMYYTFGSAADLLFDAINLALMLYAPTNLLDDLTASGPEGFVFLIDKIKKAYAL